MHQRTNQRGMAFIMDISQSTLHRYINDVRDPVLVRNRPSLRPYLEADNKARRANFCISHIDDTNGCFFDMHDVVHLDEKWFYSCRDRTGFYLVLDWEDPPKRSVISKRQIQKVMFLCAVCRPRMLANGRWFDGKLGIWPFIQWIPAERWSKNRDAGTLCPKELKMKSGVYEDFILTKVLPAIAKKCPMMMKSKPIFLHHDNASPHKCINERNPRFKAACEKLKLDCRSRFQPSNSPDLNVLDLAFFNSLAKDTMFAHISNNPQAIMKHVKEC
jgi:hypothetical protein